MRRRQERKVNIAKCLKKDFSPGFPGFVPLYICVFASEPSPICPKRFPGIVPTSSLRPQEESRQVLNTPVLGRTLSFKK